jgi:hypothetical protein
MLCDAVFASDMSCLYRSTKALLRASVVMSRTDITASYRGYRNSI